MIGRLNHVAIAVPDIAKAADMYRKSLGADVSAAVAQPEVGRQAAAVRRSREDRAERERRRRGLALPVLAPALHEARVDEAAGVLVARRQLRVGARRHGRLAVRVVAPAEHRSVAAQAADVREARGQLDEGLAGRRAERPAPSSALPAPGAPRPGPAARPP